VHVSYRLESCCLALSTRDIVHHEAACSLAGVFVIEQVPVGNLGHTLVSSIAGLEVHIGGPVVAQL
jgi:hypothetical protein